MNQIKEKKSEAIYKIWHFFQWTKRQINKMFNTPAKQVPNFLLSQNFSLLPVILLMNSLNRQTELGKSLAMVCETDQSEADALLLYLPSAGELKRSV